MDAMETWPIAVARAGSFAWTSNACSVPAQKCVNGIGVPKVMDAGDAALRCADVGSAEERAHPQTEAPSRIGPQPSRAIDEERCVRVVWKATSRSEIAINFVDAVLGESDEARLVKLRRAHEQRALGHVVVGEDEADERTAAQSGRVEEHDDEAVHVCMQGRR